MCTSIRPYIPADREQTISLWKRVFDYSSPHNSPEKSLDRILAFSPDMLLIADDNGTVTGTVIGGYDGHRGWIYSLAVEPSRRFTGIGRALVQAITERLRHLGCPKVNLQILSENIGVIEFYNKLGFTCEDRISMGKVLKEDLPGEPVDSFSPF